MRKMPEVQNIFAITGNGAPNRGIIYAGLTGYSERKGAEHSASAVVDRLRAPFPESRERSCFAFCLPQFKAWASLAASSMKCRTRVRIRSKSWRMSRRTWFARATARKDLTGLFSSYTASDPQFLVTIDREKAKSLHVPLQQITDTLRRVHGLRIR